MINLPETKYQIGDVIYGKISQEHYLIEDIKLHPFWGHCYFFRILETNETSEDTVGNVDKAKNFYKVG